MIIDDNNGECIDQLFQYNSVSLILQNHKSSIANPVCKKHIIIEEVIDLRILHHDLLSLKALVTPLKVQLFRFVILTTHWDNGLGKLLFSKPNILSHTITLFLLLTFRQTLLLSKVLFFCSVEHYESMQIRPINIELHKISWR